MRLAFPLPSPAVPIQGSDDSFPVRRIWCVGRNYAEHAREMGFSDREFPFFFAKPADAVVPSGGEVPYPPRTTDLHHEIELVVAVGKGGTDIPVARAADFIFGCAVGVDLTRRDLQALLRKEGRPWEMAKAFDHSAPVGPLRPGPPPERAAIWLSVDGLERQRSDIAHMIWSVPEILANLSGFVALAPGDLIFTGTPEGVGPLQRGSAVRGGIEGIGELAFTVG
ncbi:MAG: fumarylacetoacetate hydrolase family protein [Acidobacteria bacterium]|nr:fumarylacetoacetate hydrolase family protein [Acidobacteriota bacterium]